MIRQLAFAGTCAVFALVAGCGGGSGDTALTTVPTAHLSITLGASEAIARSPYSFTVSALDANGVVVTTYVGTVKITSSDTSAILPANATLTKGVGTFAVAFNSTGDQTITATDTVGDATAGSSGAVTVKPVPVPTATSLSPAHAMAGSGTITLTVDGSGFVPGAVVQWNGSARDTQFVSNTRVTAVINKADLASAGTANVSVSNPTPGGGDSGALVFKVVPVLAGCQYPQSMAIDGAGRFAYVTYEICDSSGIGYVFEYAIDQTTGVLTQMGSSASSQFEAGAGIALDPLGRFAYVASFGGGDSAGGMASYTVNSSSGALALAGTIEGSCPGLCGPYVVSPHPSGHFVYVAYAEGEVGGGIASFSVDAATGNLTAFDLIGPDSGQRIRAVLVSPNGKYAYALSNYTSGGDSGFVETYAIDTSTGALTRASTLLVDSYLTSIASDSSGDHLYVTDADTNTVHTLTASSSDGSLALTSAASTGADPVGIAIHPNGKFAYVASNNSDTVTVYSIDAATGSLASVATVVTEVGPTFVAIDPTGRFAYVTNGGSGDISMYTIDGTNGTLTPVGPWDY